MVVLFLAQNIEITKFSFYKNCFTKKENNYNFFVKLLHKSFVKKSLLEYTFKVVSEN